MFLLPPAIMLKLEPPKGGYCYAKNEDEKQR